MALTLDLKPPELERIHICGLKPPTLNHGYFGLGLVQGATRGCAGAFAPGEREGSWRMWLSPKEREKMCPTQRVDCAKSGSASELAGLEELRSQWGPSSSCQLSSQENPTACME
jgi:hypothetical protein